MKKNLTIIFAVLSVVILLILGYFFIQSKTQVSADTTSTGNSFTYVELKEDTIKSIDYTPGSWEKIGSNILNLLSYAAGTVLIIMLLVGGVMYITSAGKEEQTEKAKSVLVNAIIGIVVVIVAYSTVVFISNYFG